MEGQNAGQVSPLRLSVPMCTMGASGGITCVAVKARTFSPPSLTSCSCFPAVRVSPCHSRQPSVISDASAAEGDRSSTPSDINSPRHRTHSLCNVRPAAAGPGPWALPGSRRGGWRGEDVPAVSSRPPREHSGEGISCSVLSFCKKRWMWGEKERRPICFLCPGGQGKS